VQFFFAAHAGKQAILDHPEDLLLERQRQLADLVELVSLQVVFDGNVAFLRSSRPENPEGVAASSRG